VKVPVITVRIQKISRHIRRLRLQFLHANDIRAFFLHPFKETFFAAERTPFKLAETILVIFEM
jgi:hypothetical protein